MKFLLAACLAVLSSPAWAQVGVGAGIGPDFSGQDARKKKTQAAEDAPLAKALDLALGATIWANVAISSSGPVAEMTRLVAEGYYKLELIQLVLMSAQAHQPLKRALEKRKKGAALFEIAAEYKLDYDKLYEEALAVEELVDGEYLPRFYKAKKP